MSLSQLHPNTEQLKRIENAFGNQIHICGNCSACQEHFDENGSNSALNRTVVREGVLKKRTRVGTTQKRYFFLFSDLFLYAKYSKAIVSSYNGHKFSLCQILNRFSANENVEGSTPLSFQITSADKSFVVFTENPQDKYDWLEAISKVSLKCVESTRGSAPVWVPDNSTTRCYICQITFTFTNRRHHCRKCGLIVCNNCSLSRELLPNATVSNGPVRVCDKCSAKRIVSNSEANGVNDSLRTTNNSQQEQTDANAKIESTPTNTSQQEPKDPNAMIDSLRTTNNSQQEQTDTSGKIESTQATTTSQQESSNVDAKIESQTTTTQQELSITNDCASGSLETPTVQNTAPPND